MLGSPRIVGPEKLIENYRDKLYEVGKQQIYFNMIHFLTFKGNYISIPKHFLLKYLK